MRISAKDFDPVSAFVYAPKREVADSGEPITSGKTRILGPIRILPPTKRRFGLEKLVEKTILATSDFIISFRRTTSAITLTADMWFEHRNKRYDILSYLGYDEQKEVAHYLVRYLDA